MEISNSNYDNFFDVNKYIKKQDTICMQHKRINTERFIFDQIFIFCNYRKTIID